MTVEAMPRSDSSQHGEQRQISFSVIICTYTDARFAQVIAAVQSVQDQGYPALEILLVVDHNPALLAQARTRWPDLVVLANCYSQGLSGARNTGVEAAGGEIVAFLDDDAEAAPGWLECLQSRYADPLVVAVGGSIVPLWETPRPAWFPPEFDWVVGCTYRGMPVSTSPVRNLIGANMSFRRTPCLEAGGFQSTLGRVGASGAGCEETELCIRIRQQDPRRVLLYEPRAKVYHHVPSDRARWRYFAKRCLAEGRSKAQVAASVGAGDGLSSEREYTFKTLPRGCARGLAEAVFKGDRAGLWRAGAIALGLGSTAVSYGLARAGQRRGTSAESAAAEAPDASPALRILMVTPRYFPFSGGVEHHVRQVAERLARRGADVTVLTADPTGDLPAEERIDGVSIRRVRAWPARRDYYFAPSLYNVIKRGHWDVMHCQSYHTLVAPMAMIAALRAGLPYVLTFHGGGHSSRLRHAARGLQLALLRPLLARASRLIAVAAFEPAFYGRRLRVPEDRFVTIPNGSDIEVSESLHAVMPEPGLIVSIGRLEQYKGHQRILAAFPAIVAQRPDARLWIMGQGPYEATLRLIARELGVESKVEIRGIPPGDREGVAAGLARASLVTLFSDYETHPIAVLEALALERSVLVADTSGLRELAEQGLVRAIPLQSTPDQIAAAVLDQLEHPMHPGHLDLPTWDDCANELLKVYSEVAKAQACVS